MANQQTQAMTRAVEFADDFPSYKSRSAGDQDFHEATYIYDLARAGEFGLETVCCCVRLCRVA